MAEVLYVTGGEQRRNASVAAEWFAFQQALVVRVDADGGQVERVLEYVSPEQHRPDDTPSIVFKSATRNGDLLTVCTQTEVLDVRLPGGDIERTLSLPIFNDVHHVLPRPTGYVVAVTGLDMVAEVSLRGEIVREWNTSEVPTWERFSRVTDYRKVHTTKPHLSHPNYVFAAEDALWATRFEQRDAIRLDPPGARIDIGVERPHDGVVVGEHVYFTTVDGHIVVADVVTHVVEAVIDLNRISDDGEPLGWCRGIAVDGDRVWVGFSRIRATKMRENLSWLRHGFRYVDPYRVKPTRIAQFDVVRRTLLREIDLEPYGVNAVFAVLSAGDRF